MHLEQSFSVPLGIEQTWRALLDLDRTAGCIPGATIASIDGDQVTGSLKIRLATLGPTYKGTATVVEQDADSHRAIVEARADTRTNGTATARIVVTLSEGDGSTHVTLRSDLELTGKPAGLEEKVISDAGDRLVKQFASRFADLLANPVEIEPVEPPPTDSAEAAPVEPPPTDSAEAAPVEPPPTDSAEPAPPKRRPSPHPRPAAVLDDNARPERTSTADGGAHAAPTAPSNRAKQLAPVAIIVVLLLLRRRRRRRRRQAAHR